MDIRKHHDGNCSQVIQHRFLCLILLAAPGALAGCGQDEDKADAQVERDPLLVQALNDQLMVDPDLAFQNEANAALTVSFDRTLPPIDASPEAVAAIRDEMRMKMLEGGAVLELPSPEKRGKFDREASSALARACNGKGEVDHSAIWAARLPDFAAIPPRGAVMKAAGGDLPQCSIRRVTYLTPVQAEEIMQFHFTLVSRAGFKPRLLMGRKGAMLLQAELGAAQLAIAATALPSGLLNVEVTSMEPAA